VQVGTDTSHGVFAVVDQPIRSYIAAHCAGLQISASTVYTLWQAVGLFGLIGGAFRSSGARLTWTAWGVASVAMVYKNALNCVRCNIAHGDESDVAPAQCR
jgi:hypothetical protein